MNWIFRWLRQKSLRLLADFLIGGSFWVQCYNVDGTLAWEAPIKNGVTNAGLNDILSVYLAAGSQKTTWYIGLINNAGFSALAAADTMAVHTGWAEATTYSESVRQTWTPGAVAGQTVTNPTPATFTASGSVTINGIFIVSNSTKSGTTGTMWATGSFDSARSLTTGQALKVTYSCGAAGS